MAAEPHTVTPTTVHGDHLGRPPGKRAAFVADHIEAPQAASGPTSGPVFRP